MDLAGQDTDATLEPSIHGGDFQVPIAATYSIILLSVATFILQLCLALGLIYQCWKHDREVQLIQQSNGLGGKAADGGGVDPGDKQTLIPGTEKCSDSEIESAAMPFLPYVFSGTGWRTRTHGQWDIEMGHFPPWDLPSVP